MAPSGPAGVCEEAGPGAGDGVEGHGREVGQVGEEAPVGHVLAEGDPVDLLVAGHQRCRPGPKATTSLRKAVADTVSVTPTTRVVRRVRARPASTASSGEPASGVARETTSSGHSTSCGRGAVVACSTSAVAAIWAASTTAGSIWDLRNPRAPPPCTAAVGHRAHRRAAVGGVVGDGHAA